MEEEGLQKRYQLLETAFEKLGPGNKYERDVETVHRILRKSGILTVPDLEWVLAENAIRNR